VWLGKVATVVSGNGSLGTVAEFLLKPIQTNEGRKMDGAKIVGASGGT
jgi:hypothetical protein